MDTEEQDGPPAPMVLFGHLAGMWKARAIYTAAELGVAELLAQRPRTVADLAVATRTHEATLYRLLRALARVGVFEERPGRSFANNDVSWFLRPDVPGSMYAMAMGCADWGWRNWGDLTESVRTGESAFERVHGEPMWRWFRERDQRAGALFDESMTGFSASVDQPVSDALDLDGVTSVVDVGGGRGRLLRTILEQHPGVTDGVLLDQEGVLADVDAGERLRPVAGDFFAAVPEHADVYLMKMILHDWDDAECVRILDNCRRAMNPDGRVVAVEMVLDTDEVGWFPYFLDLQILVCLFGRERTEDELRELYAAAGLRLTRIVRTQSLFSLVEGVAL